MHLWCAWGNKVVVFVFMKPLQRVKRIQFNWCYIPSKQTHPATGWSCLELNIVGRSESRYEKESWLYLVMLTRAEVVCRCFTDQPDVARDTHVGRGGLAPCAATHRRPVGQSKCSTAPCFVEVRWTGELPVKVILFGQRHSIFQTIGPSIQTYGRLVTVIAQL